MFGDLGHIIEVRSVLPFPHIIAHITTAPCAAYRASQYLQSLLDNGSIVPEESHSLDTIYKDYHPSSSSIPQNQGKQEKSEEGLRQRHTSSSTSSSSTSNSNPNSNSPPPPLQEGGESTSTSQTQPEQEVLLSRDAVPAIISIFGLKGATEEAELYRALIQARLRAEGKK